MKHDDYSKLDFGINVSKYLPSEMIPSNPVITRLTLDGPLPLDSHPEVCLIYVSEGKGTITINGTSRSAEPGTLIYLVPQSIYSLSPLKGSSMELIRCLCGNGLLLFFEMCPYFDGQLMKPSTTDEVVYMKDQANLEAKRILTELLQEEMVTKKDQFDDIQTILLLMELWGLFFHEADKKNLPE